MEEFEYEVTLRIRDVDHPQDDGAASRRWVENALEEAYTSLREAWLVVTPTDLKRLDQQSEG